MDVITEDFTNLHEAKNIMAARAKEKDLVYEQKIALEYLEKVSKISKKSLEDIIADLQKITILKPRYVALIVNMMPDTENEVNALFSKEMTKLTSAEIKQIISIVKKYKK